MDEPDLEPEDPGPGRLVDQLDAVLRQALELGRDVGDLEGQVVHPGPAPGDEPADRRVRAERREQLDPAAAEPHRRGLDALVGDQLAVLELGAEQARVRLDGLVEVGDGQADVVDSPRCHPGDAIQWRGAGGRDRIRACPCASPRSSCSRPRSSRAAARPGRSRTASRTRRRTRSSQTASQAAKAADSVHIAGTINAGGKITIDLSLAAGKGGKGKIQTNGMTFEIISTGGKVYFKTNAAALQQLGGGVAAQLLQGRWIVAPASLPQLALAHVADRPDEALRLASPPRSGRSTKGDTSDVNGQPAIARHEHPQGRGTLYVATTGEPYPLKLAGLVGGHRQHHVRPVERAGRRCRRRRTRSTSRS